MIESALKRLTLAIKGKVSMLRAVVSAIRDGKMLLLDGTGRPGEELTGRELWAHYGLVTKPLAGAEAIAIVSGNVIHVIASDDSRYRLEIADGEVALYDDTGNAVHLRRGDGIRMYSPARIVCESPSIEMECDSFSLSADSIEMTAETVLVTGGSRIQLLSAEVLSGAASGHKQLKDKDDNPTTNTKAT